MKKNYFIINYVADCAKENKNPIESAKEEIEIINKKVKETDVLILRRRNLLAVLDYCGHKTLGKTKDNDINSADLKSSNEELTEMQNKIRSVLKTKGPMTVREIINSVASYENNQDYLVTRSIKELGVSNQIIRDNDKYQLN